MDELFEKAKKILEERGSFSPALLQRKLKITFEKAKEIYDYIYPQK